MGRLRRDEGQTSAEYLGMLVIVALLIGALFASGLGAGLADSLRAAVCEITGTSCPVDVARPFEPAPCTVATREASVDASLKVTFVKVGASEGYVREERADGTIHVTWVSDGSVGATAGAGAQGSIEIGGNGMRGGARISGDVDVGVSRGQTWVFTDPDEAQRYIDAQREEAIRRHTGIVGVIDRVVRGSEDLRPPDIVAFDVTSGATISGGAGFGPVNAGGEAEGAVVLGGTRDNRTGETTLYVEVGGELSGSAGVLLGMSGSENRGRVVALTLDADNQPKTLTVTSSSETGRGGLLEGSGYTLDQLDNLVAEATVDATGEGTHSVVVASELDLRDPANRDAAAALLSASATSSLPGGSERLADAAAQVQDRMLDNGTVAVTEHEGSTWGLGAGAEVALGPKLGFDVGYDSRESNLTGASFLDQLPDGSREMVPWTSCTG